MPAGKAAPSGTRAHQKIRTRGIEGYRAEVELTRPFPGERLDLALSGRADGVYEKDGLTHIEEIKSTGRQREELGKLGRYPYFTLLWRFSKYG